MIAMIESAMAVWFPYGSNLCSSSSVPCHRSLWSSEEFTGVHVSGRRSSFDMPCGYQKLSSGGYVARRKSNVRKKVRATAEHLGSAPDPLKCNGRSGYHPFEDVAELASEKGGDASLTPAETSRTIVEVHNKATLFFSGLVNEEVHENIIWPDLPYVNDDHGNIYFQVNTEEDILQNIASESNVVQLIIGLDTSGLINDMKVSGPGDIDFGIEEIDDEDSDVEDESDEDDEEDGGESDDSYQDWVSVLEDEDDDDDQSDETQVDWATLETMRSAHPMHFANKLAEVASDEPIDLMEGPPVGIGIEGVLRPTLPEEWPVIKQLFSDQMKEIDDNTENKLKGAHAINGDGQVLAVDLAEGNSPGNGTSYYKLELVKVQLLSVHGHPDMVEIEDFMNAKPDAIAHSAAKIISHLKAGGEKTVRALKALCWRCKGIQVEEAQIVGVDSLGFDMRVCSGTQLQTLRFAFDSRATSESIVESKLSNLLFPKSQPKPHKNKQIHRKES